MVGEQAIVVAEHVVDVQRPFLDAASDRVEEASLAVENAVDDPVDVRADGGIRARIGAQSAREPRRRPHEIEEVSDEAQVRRALTAGGLNSHPEAVELIGEAKSPDAFDFLAGHLRSADEAFRYWAIRGLNNLGTKEARTLLWEPRR